MKSLYSFWAFVYELISLPQFFINTSVLHKALWASVNHNQMGKYGSWTVTVFTIQRPNWIQFKSVQIAASACLRACVVCCFMFLHYVICLFLLFNLCRRFPASSGLDVHLDRVCYVVLYSCCHETATQEINTCQEQHNRTSWFIPLFLLLPVNYMGRQPQPFQWITFGQK